MDGLILHELTAHMRRYNKVKWHPTFAQRPFATECRDPSADRIKSGRIALGYSPSPAEWERPDIAPETPLDAFRRAQQRQQRVERDASERTELS